MASDKQDSAIDNTALFQNTQKKFQEEWERFLHDEKTFTSFYENTKKIDQWLKEKGPNADS